MVAYEKQNFKIVCHFGLSAVINHSDIRITKAN